MASALPHLSGCIAMNSIISASSISLVIPKHRHGHTNVSIGFKIVARWSARCACNYSDTSRITQRIKQAYHAAASLPPLTKDAGLLTIKMTESPRRNNLLIYRSLLTTVPRFFPLPPLEVSVQVSLTSSINLYDLENREVIIYEHFMSQTSLYNQNTIAGTNLQRQHFPR